MKEQRREGAASVCAQRRAMLCQALSVAAAGLLPLRAADAASDARKLSPQPGDELVLPSWESPAGAIVAGDVLLDAAPLLVFPRDPASGIARERSRLNQILLLRLAPDSLPAAARALAADGVLAYSGICTHAACGVSGWDAAQAALVCPCHASHFAAAERGRVLSGPATRGLPLLPLTLSGQRLLVAGPFTGTVGAAQP